jgi:beta-glucosidase
MSLAVWGISSQAQAPLPDSPAIEQRVDSMLSKLTLQQKIDLIGGYNDAFIRPEPSVGFRELKMSDGPEGVRTWGPATAYAGGIALAATWDPDLAGRMGICLGQDARARGVHILLAPGVNITRAPMDSRNMEYFGEDPFLASRIAVGYIEGVQSQGVIATVKHFAANNQEYDRYDVSSDLDERTLREIYLPAFEAAVKEAHVGAVMDSLNLLNGEHATQNAHLNLDILKKDWGFDGILMSDWGATYDGVAAANAGLDLEMNSGKYMNEANLLPAIRTGKVSESAIDDKVRRIFRTAIRFGFLDRDQTNIDIPRDNPQGRQVALEEARESIVLLKNEHSLLPLDVNKIHTLAVIGPDAWPAVPGGGGSSNVTPYAAVSLLNGLETYLGERVKVLYARGLPTAEEMFRETKFGTSNEKAAQNDYWSGPETVKAEAFKNADFCGASVILTTRRIDGGSEDRLASLAGIKSIRYTAVYTSEKTGEHLFLAEAQGQDAYTLLVDGRQVLRWVPQREQQSPQSVIVALTAGKPAHIQLDYVPAAENNRIKLGVRAMDDLISPAARRIASAVDAVIVSVGFDPTTEQEGMDRSFGLPWGQDKLINAIKQANSKTTVTLTGGGNVDMRPWLADVPALLHSWYPGEEGGTALAEILFGERSPEGHLPVSFERSWEENPAHEHYYAAPAGAGQIRHVKYGEGVFVGYRYYTTVGKMPLFPFGYGLSYTTFSFDNLSVSPAQTTNRQEITVSFDVTNTGRYAGADVAQVYVGDPSAKVKRPTKELKGFQKVRLAPGEKQHVAIMLDSRAFAYWSNARNGWQVDAGRFDIFVGDSSENTPLTAEVTMIGSAI